MAGGQVLVCTGNTEDGQQYQNIWGAHFAVVVEVGAFTLTQAAVVAQDVQEVAHVDGVGVVEVAHTQDKRVAAASRAPLRREDRIMTTIWFWLKI